MPFCIECGAKFSDWALVCPECGRHISDEIPPPHDEDEDEEEFEIFDSDALEVEEHDDFDDHTTVPHPPSRWAPPPRRSHPPPPSRPPPRAHHVPPPAPPRQPPRQPPHHPPSRHHEDHANAPPPRRPAKKKKKKKKKSAMPIVIGIVAVAITIGMVLFVIWYAGLLESTTDITDTSSKDCWYCDGSGKVDYEYTIESDEATLEGDVDKYADVNLRISNEYYAAGEFTVNAEVINDGDKYQGSKSENINGYSTRTISVNIDVSDNWDEIDDYNFDLVPPQETCPECQGTGET
ncbi:MAG: hypothetical protein JSV49_10790 [Thermoplasmata archaeon]|nr:MAG: hypothetical protein JSV49_10790 [Thermoplasmata archaeon]